MDIQAIILAAIPVLFGVTFIWTKVDKLLAALRELGDVLTVVTKSLEDKKLSPEEIVAIKKEVGEAIAAFKAVLK